MNETQETDATGSPRQIDWSLLRPYARGLQVLGWVLIVLFSLTACAVLPYYYFYVLGSYARGHITLYQLFSPSFWMGLRLEFFPGLVLLVLAQLMRCLGDRECSPGWILRHGHWILVLYAAYLLDFLGVRYYNVFTHQMPTGTSSILSTLTMMALPILVQVTILLGAALIFRRLVSIIEESKTLV